MTRIPNDFRQIERVLMLPPYLILTTALPPCGRQGLKQKSTHHDPQAEYRLEGRFLLMEPGGKRIIHIVIFLYYIQEGNITKKHQLQYLMSGMTGHSR